ncbi:MAG: oxidoreductase [Sinomicrobium sp.]|nr:oxidoreductase [Sinomicrobium sp.]
MAVKPIFVLVLAVALMVSCQKKYQPRTVKNVHIQTFAIDSTSIRAIVVINDSTVWYAGSGGAYGSISGNTITQNRMKYESDSMGARYPNFRSIAGNGDGIFALSIENPALLIRLNTTPEEIVYREDHSRVFYDSMAFFDAEDGIAFGDPTEDCPSVILTHDGGQSWYKLDCTGLPETEAGEAAFAASNTNIAIAGDNAWLVTGGKRSRVFHTPDRGKRWMVYDTPIVQGKPTTGSYTVAFYDATNGIVFGGDYTDKKSNTANKAVTADGGRTWTLIADGEAPGYISCVQYVPGAAGMELFAVSTEGIYFSNNGGHTWTKLSSEGYYSIRFSGRHTAWLSGNNTIARMNF